MNVDLALPPRIREGVAAARVADDAERIGWIAETTTDPTVVASAALAATERLRVGTGVAIAFARSPFVLAQAAWELARASDGRFVLGLGTQVKSHRERRLDVSGDRPLARIRDYVGALRAIWTSFQTGARLNYQGEFHRHTLLTDYFDPGPIDHPDIPVFLAGVNAGMATLVGQVANGIFAHPLHSQRYLADALVPAIEAGAARAGRSRAEVEVLAPVWVVTGRDDAETDAAREAIRSQLAFYGSTRTYRAVFETHGWDDVPARLHDALTEHDPAALRAIVTDEMVETFAVCAPPDEVPRAIAARLSGLADRVLVYDPIPPALPLPITVPELETVSTEGSS